MRNLLGATLVVLALIMSVPGIPGTGIMTILIGVMVMGFAEKRRWTRWVIGRPPILRTANGLRRKYVNILVVGQFKIATGVFVRVVVNR